MKSALVSAFLVGFGAQAAAAGSAWSAYGYYTVAGNQYYYTVAGNQYRNQALVVTDISSHTAGAATYTRFSSGSTPSGWAGSQGRQFYSSGTMYCAGATAYNTGVDAVGYSCTPSGVINSWYSYGVSWGWNGGGYSPSYTYQSPNQNS